MASSIPQGIKSIVKRVPDILEDGENRLPGTLRKLLERLNGNFKEMDRQMAELIDLALLGAFHQGRKQCASFKVPM